MGLIVLGAVATIASVLLFARNATPRSGAAQPAAPTACAQRLLADWRDGRIDGTYRLSCYRDAMRALPTDLLVYSSAADDILAARSQRIVQSAKSAPGEASTRPAG